MKNDQRKRFWGVGALAVALAATLAGCADQGGLQGTLDHMDEAVRYKVAALTGSGDVGGWYNPAVGEPHEIKDIFGDQWNAYGQIKWPRVALEVTSYGAQLHCWSYTATIWKDERSSHVEHFTLCDNAPTPMKTDTATGEKRTGIPDGTQLAGTMVMPSVPNTGSTRTAGPKPPHDPLGMEFLEGSSPGHPSPMQQAYWRQLSRLGYLTGFNGHEDPRMWIVRFDPAGKRS